MTYGQPQQPGQPWGPQQHGAGPQYAGPQYGSPPQYGSVVPGHGPQGYPGYPSQPPGKRPTGLIVALVAVVVAVLGVAAVGAFLVLRDDAQQASGEQSANLDAFVPRPGLEDPSEQIDGIVIIDPPGALHVGPDEQVPYEFAPPFGGKHDSRWADCTGVVYAEAIRSENAVHALEHGAVWITYNPEDLDSGAVEALAEKVEDRPYTFMSPYPELDAAFSLQSWGHQLKLDDAADERVDQFLTALRNNPNTTPEVGATCSSPGFEGNPPPFAPPPAP